MGKDDVLVMVRASAMKDTSDQTAISAQQAPTAQAAQLFATGSHAQIMEGVCRMVGVNAWRGGREMLVTDATRGISGRCVTMNAATTQLAEGTGAVERTVLAYADRGSLGSIVRYAGRIRLDRS